MNKNRQESKFTSRSTRRKPQPVADDTRARLLRAAAEVFADLGYYNATVRRICSRAGVNIALVKYYFGDKLELYSEVLRQLASHTPAIRTTLEQDAPAEAVLREAIKIRLRSAYLGELPGWDVRILCHEIARPSPAMTRIINEVSRPIYDRFRQLIGKILRLPPDAEDTILSTHSVAGQIFFYVLASPILARLSPELKMTPDKVNRIADHIADFSLAYLRRREPGSAAGRQRRGRR